MSDVKQKGLSQYTALFQAIIAGSAVISIFAFVVNLVVSPMKTDIKRLDQGQKQLVSSQKHLEQGQKEILDRLKKLEDLFKNTQ